MSIMLRTILGLVWTAGLWAQELEMTTYFMAFLRRPANAPQISKEAGEKLQEAHMAHIRKMADDGKLLLAGPFMDDTPLRGIYVFKTATMEEAKALGAEDPAVKAGRLVLEWHPWYSAKNIVVVQNSKGETK